MPKDHRAELLTSRWPLTARAGRTEARLRGSELHRAWTAFLGRIPWEHFLTLTFDPRRVGAVSRGLADDETLRWLEWAAYVTRLPLAWAYAVERGQKGRWHGHAVIAGTATVNWSLLEAVWSERCGTLHVEPVYDATGVTRYLTKSGANVCVVVADTVTLQRFPDLNADIVVPLASPGACSGQ